MASKIWHKWTYLENRNRFTDLQIYGCQGGGAGVGGMDWEFGISRCKLFYISVQFSSVAQSCPTLCDPMNRSTPSLPVHHQLLEFTQIHMHRLHWSPVAYWAPTDLGSSSFSILSICLFILFMGFSRQEYWSGLPFPSPVDHILSALSTTTFLSWVAPRAWLSFIDLDKAVVLVWLDWLAFCEYGSSVHV